MMIRTATFEDIPRLIEMGEALRAESPVFSKMTPDFERARKVLEALITSDDACVILNEDQTGMFIGHIEEQMWCKERIAVDDVFCVVPEHRKSGRATELLTRFLDWTVEKKVPFIRMGISTEVSVEATSRFYEHHGFKKTGVLFTKEN